MKFPIKPPMNFPMNMGPAWLGLGPGPGPAWARLGLAYHTITNYRDIYRKIYRKIYRIFYIIFIYFLYKNYIQTI